MNKLQRKRLCWNCEGSVSIAEETCPFCGVSVVPAFLEGTGAHFAPPYSTISENEADIPKSPYDQHLAQTHSEAEENEKAQEQTEPALDEFKRIVLAVILLLTGSVFFFFSLALALFSHHGILTLHWNASLWFIYIFLAFPMLFWGWRTLMKLDES